MTKTGNYQLPQWEPHDPVRRTDFNAAFAKIETMGYAVGSYVGDGAELADGGQFIELGFKPRFVLISRGAASYNTSPISTFMLTEHQVTGAERYACLNDTGFTVGQCSSQAYSYTLNIEGLPYSFVAFQ